MRAPEAPEGFVAAEEGGWTIVARRDEIAGTRAIVTRLWGTSPAAGRTSERPARGAMGPMGRGEVHHATDAAGRALVIKILHRGGLAGRIGGRHGQPRLIAEMTVLEEARRRGVPTARLAWGASLRSSRGESVSLLATRRIEESLTLAEALRRARRAGPPRRERYQLLETSGAAVRRMHDLGLDHSDLNIGNILVRPSKRDSGAWVIDLGVSRLGASLPPGRRAENLVRLLRSAEKHLGSDPSRRRDAAAFLHGYLRRDEETGRALRRALLRAIRRRLPSIALHRLGWAITRAASARRSRPRPR